MRKSRNWKYRFPQRREPEIIDICLVKVCYICIVCFFELANHSRHPHPNATSTPGRPQAEDEHAPNPHHPTTPQAPLSNRGSARANWSSDQPAQSMLIRMPHTAQHTASAQESHAPQAHLSRSRQHLTLLNHKQCLPDFGRCGDLGSFNHQEDSLNHP